MFDIYLEGKIKDRQAALQKFKEKILRSDKVFEHCIPKSVVTNQQPAQDQKPEN